MSANRAKWLGLAALLLGGALLGAVLSGGRGRRVTGERLAGYLPGAVELASLTGAPVERVRIVAPPINPEYAETAARALSKGRLPLPDDRAVVTYRRTDRESETTVALLLYDRSADADLVAQLAGPLIQQALGLEPGEQYWSPAPHGNAEDRFLSQHWRGPGYRALTFRVGDVIGLVGTTDPQSDPWLDELGGLIAAKLLARPPEKTSTVSATGGDR